MVLLLLRCQILCCYRKKALPMGKVLFCAMREALVPLLTVSRSRKRAQGRGVSSESVQGMAADSFKTGNKREKKNLVYAQILETRLEVLLLRD
jgi:hypothetical protein